LLSSHCVRFCSALTRHHTAEDRRAFPALAAQHPELAPLIAKLEGDHRLIGGIVGRVASPVRSTSSADRPRTSVGSTRASSTERLTKPEEWV
jgi:hypothetical protein